MVSSGRRQPLDSGGRFAVGCLALGHHHRLGASLDSHDFGGVLRLGWWGGGDKKEKKSVSDIEISKSEGGRMTGNERGGGSGRRDGK